MSDAVSQPPYGIFDLGEFDGQKSLMTAGQGALPLNCDWAWRAAEFYRAGAIAETSSPRSGVDIGPSVKLYLGGAGDQIGVFADRPVTESGPIGLGLAMTAVAGEFLSLSFAAPETAVKAMTKYTLFQCDLVATVDDLVTFYLRLNVKYGASVAKFTQMVETGGGHHCVIFDLGFHAFDVGAFSKIWLDIMIANPQKNRIVLNDMTLLRRPRGQF